MSPRAAAALVVAITLGILGLTPWTLNSPALSDALAGQVKREYGVDLVVSGPITFTVLPMPRVKLASVSIRDPGGLVAIEAGQLKGVLRLPSLLLGHARIADARLVGADIAIDLSRLPGSDLGTTLAALRSQIESADETSWINRIVVVGSRVRLSRGASGPETVWPRFAAVLRWPDKGDLDLTASATWNGEPFTVSVAGLNLARALAGAPDSVEVTASGRPGRLRLVGDVSLRNGAPRFSGLGAATVPSVGVLARWTGLGRDFGIVDRPAAISGNCVIGLDGIEWPQVVMTVGEDRLDGSFAMLTSGNRPQVRATLAGTTLDLGWVIPMADPEKAAPPSTDYDVRLSASLLRMGALRLGDVATGILVRGDRLEVSLARATLAEGSVRGRLSAILDGEARDIRAQVTLDGLRFEQFAAETGLASGFSGVIGGQATLEANGEGQDLGRTLRGRISVQARDGEINGIALASPARSEAAGPDRRGRTRFGRATILLDVRDGGAEITEGRIEGPEAETSLSGRLSLGDGMLAVTAVTRPTGEGARGQPIVTDVRGPIAAPSVATVQTTGTIRPAATR